MKIFRNVVITLLLIALALFSIVKLAPVTTNPDNNQMIIEQLDGEINTVLKLTGAAAGASAVISLLPDDQCTPIANELAELAKYFLVVLSALYLEKYLVSLVGFASFAFIIPVGLALFGVGLFGGKRWIRTVAYKLGAFALALYMLIPLSTTVSNYIYSHYETSIESTIDQADKISVNDNNENTTAVERFKNWVENAAVSVSSYVTTLLSNFVDALAVMLVTSCLIPILVVLVFAWLMKILFGVQPPIEFPKREKVEV